MGQEVFGGVQKGAQSQMKSSELDLLVVDASVKTEVLLRNSSVLPPFWANRHEAHITLPAHPVHNHALMLVKDRRSREKISHILMIGMNSRFEYIRALFSSSSSASSSLLRTTTWVPKELACRISPSKKVWLSTHTIVRDGIRTVVTFPPINVGGRRVIFGKVEHIADQECRLWPWRKVGTFLWRQPAVNGLPQAQNQRAERGKGGVNS